MRNYAGINTVSWNDKPYFVKCKTTNIQVLSVRVTSLTFRIFEGHKEGFCLGVQCDLYNISSTWPTVVLEVVEQRVSAGGSAHAPHTHRGEFLGRSRTFSVLAWWLGVKADFEGLAIDRVAFFQNSPHSCNDLRNHRIHDRILTVNVLSVYSQHPAYDAVFRNIKFYMYSMTLSLKKRYTFKESSDTMLGYAALYQSITSTTSFSNVLHDK